MLSGDCNVCINGKLPSYSATCVECGLSRKNFKPITNYDRIRAMTDEELAAKIEELCQYAFMQIRVYAKPFGKAEWLDWLKEEAKE